MFKNPSLGLYLGNKGRDDNLANVTHAHINLAQHKNLPRLYLNVFLCMQDCPKKQNILLSSFYIRHPLPQAHVCTHLVPSWWHCVGKL